MIIRYYKYYKTIKLFFISNKKLCVFISGDSFGRLSHKKFYLSSTQISPIKAQPGSMINHIRFDCGEKIENFNEQKLIENYNMYSTVDTNNAPDILSSVLTYQKISC